MDLTGFSVEEFTTPNPVTADEDSTIDQLVALMRQNNVRHIPILREDKVVGIVSDRDCRVASGLAPSEKLMVRAADIMATDPVTVSAGDSLDEVAFEMSEHKIGSVIVNDESDNFLGIFTASDALNALIEIIRKAKADEDLD